MSTGAQAQASAMPEPRLRFRADINGLRAIAVLSVLAFHFAITPFRSGFIGVDVFFVISGYLMTAIILGRMERGTFSVAGFWLDRARRIIPALALLVFAVLVSAWFNLLPDEYIILAKHSGSAVTFLSNILFWTEAGYFDTDAGLKWLLHTWSLSVEWQFYLLYPLVVLALARFLRGNQLWLVMVAMAAASFALMLWLHETRPSAAFYLLPPRAWEMLVGGIAFLTPSLSGRAARVGQLAGLALILASTLAFEPQDWPHIGALMPVLGTAMVILAGRTDSRITGNILASRIGLASYSIYLWHWPLVVWLRRSEHTGDWPWVAGALALSFLLGWLSWRFVEPMAQPRTKRPHVHTARIAFDWRSHLTFAVLVAVILGMSGAVWKLRGIPSRYSAEVRLAAEEAAPRTVPGAADCFSSGGDLPKPCILGPAQSPMLASYVGDSYADSAFSGFIAAVPTGAKGGVAFQAYRACPPVIGARNVNARDGVCGAFLKRTLEPLAAPRIAPLVLMGAWNRYLSDPGITYDGGHSTFLASLYASTCKLAAAGPTYVVLPTPEYPFEVAHELLNRLIRNPQSPDISYPLAEHLQRNNDIIAVLRRAERECGARLLDPAPYLCPNGQCMGSIGHRAVIRDHGHFTNFGASRLTPMFAPVFAGH